VDGGQAAGVVTGKAGVGGQRIGIHLHLVAQFFQAFDATAKRPPCRARRRRGIDVDVFLQVTMREIGY